MGIRTQGPLRPERPPSSPPPQSWEEAVREQLCAKCCELARAQEALALSSLVLGFCWVLSSFRLKRNLADRWGLSQSRPKWGTTRLFSSLHPEFLGITWNN